VTPKQEAFVAEYLKDLNATQAAIRAGYSGKTAYSIGEENLKKPEIAAAVQEAMDKRAERTEITQDYVLRGIQGVVEATLEDQPAVALKGYELLGKHLKLFTEKHEIGGDMAVQLVHSIPRPER
jgi:phage terminase small subunit